MFPAIDPRRHMNRITPQTFLRLSRCLLQPLQHRIPWRILPIPPAPAIFDEGVVDVGTVAQHYVRQRPPVLVLTVGLEDDISPED